VGVKKPVCRQFLWVVMKRKKRKENAATALSKDIGETLGKQGCVGVLG